MDKFLEALLSWIILIIKLWLGYIFVVLLLLVGSMVGFYFLVYRK